MAANRTTFKRGGPSPNPGGQTAEQRAARDALNRALCEPKRQKMALAAYDALLGEGNPIIVKDYFDRTAGKPKEHVEVTGVERQLEPVSTDALIAFVTGKKA